MNIVSPALLILFWSAILSFVPITFYLLLINPPLYKIEQKRLLGIYVIKQDFLLAGEKKSRARVVVWIYIACLLFFTVIHILNQVRYGHADLSPFNILSSLSVMFFWFSALSYLPIAVYLFLKNPWKSKEEGVCLTWIYISYGIGLLIFSIFYAYLWLKEKQILVGIEDVLTSLLIAIFSSTLISYLPILVYIFLMSSNPVRPKVIKMNVIFIIYSICLLIFSTIYITSWVIDKKTGAQRLPLKYYFQIK